MPMVQTARTMGRNGTLAKNGEGLAENEKSANGHDFCLGATHERGYYDYF